MYEITELIDTLAKVGNKTSNSDIVLYALAGLREDYDAFVQNIATRESEVTFLLLQAMLSN